MVRSVGCALFVDASCERWPELDAADIIIALLPASFNDNMRRIMHLEWTYGLQSHAIHTAGYSRSCLDSESSLCCTDAAA